MGIFRVIKERNPELPEGHQFEDKRIDLGTFRRLPTTGDGNCGFHALVGELRALTPYAAIDKDGVGTYRQNLRERLDSFITQVENNVRTQDRVVIWMRQHVLETPEFHQEYEQRLGGRLNLASDQEVHVFNEALAVAATRVF